LGGRIREETKKKDAQQKGEEKESMRNGASRQQQDERSIAGRDEMQRRTFGRKGGVALGKKVNFVQREGHFSSWKGNVIWDLIGVREGRGG